MKTAPSTVKPDRTASVRPGAASFAEAELGAVERKLARFIGPLAKVLVKKAAASAAGLDDLYRRLAEQLEDPKDKKAFLASRDDTTRNV